MDIHSSARPVYTNAVLRSLTVALILLGLACSAFAQTAVTGIVVDQTGSPLPGVVVGLRAAGVTRETTTDVTGRYVFDGVTEPRVQGLAVSASGISARAR